MDEATQKITETIARDAAPTSKYVVHTVQYSNRPDKQIVSLAHSLVHTLRMSAWSLAASANPIPLGVEDCVVPPVQVDGLDTVTSTKAFLRNIEKIIFGLPVKELLRRLAWLN